MTLDLSHLAIAIAAALLGFWLGRLDQQLRQFKGQGIAGPIAKDVGRVLPRRAAVPEDVARFYDQGTIDRGARAIMDAAAADGVKISAEDAYAEALALLMSGQEEPETIPDRGVDG